MMSSTHRPIDRSSRALCHPPSMQIDIMHKKNGCHVPSYYQCTTATRLTTTPAASVRRSMMHDTYTTRGAPGRSRSMPAIQALAREPAGAPGTSARASRPARRPQAVPRAGAGHARVPVRTGPLVHAGVSGVPCARARVGAVVLSAPAYMHRPGVLLAYSIVIPSNHRLT